MKNLKIKSKLILLFILIKVIPLILLSYIAIEGAKNLNTYFEQTTKNTFDKSKEIISTTATTAISDSIQALDKKSQLTLERLSYEIAHDVASFLYERDSDLLLLSTLNLNENVLRNFQKIKTSPVTEHEKYVYNETAKKWELLNAKNTKIISNKANLKDNEKEFNSNIPITIKHKKIPLYKEIQVIDLDGKEIYKVSSLSNKKINIKNQQDTYCKAENYFKELQNLKKGEIYVSNVIGEYVKTGLIGTFTKEKAKKMNIEFKPEENAYAGKENPVGKRFEGIVRFATPIFKNNKKIGYVAFALDHRHLMEFTDSFDPLPQNTKQDIADASSGNYAFMWDYKGRNISHARDYFIVGYDKETGKQVPGWLSVDVAEKFKQSNIKDLDQFLQNYPIFEEQSLKKKPNIAQLKNQGEVGLDCRYLNFAPQCEGWMQLTQDGGYGSFVIFWSGVWKLTTAAAIPYYSGQYGNSKRGFGFVTIGANVEEFHLAANKTKQSVNEILIKQVDNMKQELDENKSSVLQYISELTKELITVTFLMIIIVIAIAVWMSNIVTNKISNLLKGTKEYLKHNFNYRIDVTSKDEIGDLENSFNDMAGEIKDLIDTQNKTNALLDIKVQESNSALKAKSNFLASMSHEIRTPLNAILGFIGILKEQEKEALKLKYFNIVETSGNNLLTIINDILDFSKIESDKIELDYVTVNPYNEFVNIINQFTENENKKKLTFNINISKKLFSEFEMDISKITQVLNNLLSNAIKFSDEKGTVQLDIDYNENEQKLLVSIENDGIEIAPEKQELIFEPFTQENNSTTRLHGGTGLGLTISRKLVEHMNGKLSLDKNKKNGARFYFDIIIKQDKNHIYQDDNTVATKIVKNKPEIKLNEITNKEIKIMIAEDNPTNQIFMEALIETMSLKCKIVNNGLEAVELYQREKFDIILMDENMPLMSGSEATMKIRELEQTNNQHIPIVALTANALVGDKEKFLNIGMDDYLSKPLEKQELERVISQYMQ
ncbi:MAG: ATP-binding protein [Arcobacteraceae bacterium]